MFEKTLESPLDCKEIQPVHSKGNHPWIFIGRTDVEAETPVLWPPDAKNWLIWKDPDARKDWGQKEKEATENDIVGHEFEQRSEIVKDREPGVLQSMGSKSRTWLSDSTTQA